MRMQATVCVVTWHAVVRGVVEDVRATASPDIDHVDFSPRRLWPQPLHTGRAGGTYRRRGRMARQVTANQGNQMNAGTGGMGSRYVIVPRGTVWAEANGV